MTTRYYLVTVALSAVLCDRCFLFIYVFNGDVQDSMLVHDKARRLSCHIGLLRRHTHLPEHISNHAPCCLVCMG